MAVTPVPAADDQVVDVDAALLGSEWNTSGVAPDDGGGPLNIGIFTRAELWGRVPIPMDMKVKGGGKRSSKLTVLVAPPMWGEPGCDKIIKLTPRGQL